MINTTVQLIQPVQLVLPTHSVAIMQPALAELVKSTYPIPIQLEQPIQAIQLSNLYKQYNQYK